MRVKFWGTRGSVPTPGRATEKFGGTTACVEITSDGHRLILDAGTGIRNYSKEVVDRGIQKTFLLLTHTHWDHINGFPFYEPAYDQDHSITIMAGHLKSQGGIENILSTQMHNPMFPVPLEAI